MTPGIYPNIPWQDYAGWPAVSATAIGWFRKSPAHYRDFQSGALVRADSDAMRWGRLFHALCLEGRNDYVVSPYRDFKTKEAREWRDSQTMPVLTKDEADELDECYGAIGDNPDALRLLTGGSPEVSMLSTYPVTTIDDDQIETPVKGRADWLRNDRRQIVDLKTVRNASTEAFSRQIDEYGWHIQAALYCHILARIEGCLVNEIEYWFIALQKPTDADPVPRVNVMRLSELAIDLGRNILHDCLERLQECSTRNHWPGYYEEGKPGVVDVPQWAHAKYAASMPTELVVNGEQITH